MAILVLSLGIVCVLQIFPLALNVGGSNQAEAQAVFLAQAKMEEMTSKSYQDIICCQTVVENSLAVPFERFSRETTVNYVDSDLATSSSDLGLKRIEVVVSWQSMLRINDKKVEMLTLIVKR